MQCAIAITEMNFSYSLSAHHFQRSVKMEGVRHALIHRQLQPAAHFLSTLKCMEPSTRQHQMELCLIISTTFLKFIITRTIFVIVRPLISFCQV